jgi:DNA-binding beta-propeller fold protein YncE
MSPDIRELLHAAVGTPRSSTGFEAIWRRSRKLRVRKIVASGAGAVAMVALVVTAVNWAEQPARNLPVVGDASPTEPESDQATIDVGGHPIAVTVGEGGAWVARYEGTGEQASFAIARIDPATNEVMATIPVDGRPEDLVASAGSLWVVLSRHPAEGGMLIRVDPVTNEIDGKPTELAGRPSNLAVGGDSAWVATQDGEVLRVDAQSREVVAEFQVGEGAVVASDGNQVWVANTRGDISRIDLLTNRTVDPPVRVGWNVVDIAVEANAIWATQTTPEEEFRILRIDPRTEQLVGAPIRIDLNPGHLAVGEGAVWMLQYAISNKDLDRDGTILRIDPEANQVVGDLIETGTGSVDLAVGEGSLWVAKVVEGEIYRISPASGGEPSP